MYCAYCRTKLDDAARFCFACGKPVEMVPKGQMEKNTVYKVPSAFEESNYSEMQTEKPSKTSSRVKLSSDLMPKKDLGSNEDDYHTVAEEKYQVPESSDDNVYGEPKGSTRQIETGTNKGEDKSGFEFDQMKNSMKVLAGKAVGTASKAASQAKVMASQTKERLDKNLEESLEKDIRKANATKEKSGIVSNDHTGDKYMSTSELWTWLKKDSKRQQFYTGEKQTETEEEYIEELEKKINENEVPVKIQKRTIRWDRSDAEETLFVAVPDTKVVNPLTYIVQFSHVGKFTFVEEKTFITPPDLPPVPHNKIPFDSKSILIPLYLLLAGAGCIIFQLIPRRYDSSGGFFFAVGFPLLALAAYLFLKHNNILDYNKKCEEELRLWNKAWDNWKTSIFLHSFQEDVNGQLSRIFDSVFSCINQLNEEKYKDQKALEVQDTNDMNELEQMISRKKEEYR